MMRGELMAWAYGLVLLDAMYTIKADMASGKTDFSSE
jgi:hypothetical protein